MTPPKDGTLTALRSLLGDTTNYAAEFLERLPERAVAPTATAEELRKGGSADRCPTARVSRT